MKRRFFGTVFSLAIAVTGHAEEPPIKIGVIGPITGKSSIDMGESIRGGGRVFLNDINQIGGILGRRIEIIERDDEANPELGVKIAKELIEKEKVVAAVGYGNTGVAMPSSKVFQDAQIPLIITAATGANITRQFMPPAHPANFIFRLAASDALQPIAILDDVIERRKLTHIALLHDETPYGQFGKQNMLAELKRRNVAPMAVESFKIGEQDMTAQLTRAKQAGAQVIVLYCLANEGASVTRTAAKMNLNVPIVGSWTLSQRAYADSAGSSSEGARMAVTFVENNLSSRSNSFALTYKKINHVDHIPSAVAAAQTYDALRLLTLAMFQSGSLDGNKLREALENLQFEATSTVISRYKKPFSATDHEAITLNMIVMGEIRKGKVTYAYAEDANSSLIVRTKSK